MCKGRALQLCFRARTSKRSHLHLHAAGIGTEPLLGVWGWGTSEIRINH